MRFAGAKPSVFKRKAGGNCENTAAPRGTPGRDHLEAVLELWACRPSHVTQTVFIPQSDFLNFHNN